MPCKHIPQKIETELGTIYKCLICEEDITKWQRRLQNLYVRQRTYQGQGNYYTSWLMGIYNTAQTGGIIMLVFFPESRQMAAWIILSAWLIQTIFETWFGRFDYKHIKMAQRQQTLGASFAPTTVETLRILNELRDKMVPEKKQPSVLDKIK